MIVRTAIFGGYDAPKSHNDHPDVERWELFTDDPTIQTDEWEVIVTSHAEHPRVAAKRYKMPAFFEPDGKVRLWIDGSVMLHNSAFIDVIHECLEHDDLTMFVHPERDCIYDEAAVSKQMAKYASQDIDRQIDCYRGIHPAHGGLWASGIFGWRATPEMCDFMGAWFSHNEQFTWQDQLSLPVVLAQYQITPVPIPGNLWRNPWFTLAGHRSDL